MKVRNVSGVDRELVDPPVTVPAGHIVDVPDHIAGREPSGTDPAKKSYDPGEGLLAQPDNWKPVSSKDKE